MIIFGLTICLRLKANNCPINAAALLPAFLSVPVHYHRPGSVPVVASAIHISIDDSQNIVEIMRNTTC